MSMTKNIYTLPTFNDTVEADMITFVKNTLAPFFAEKLGLVVRDDLEVTHPSYMSGDACAFITFLAPSASAAPYLALYNSKKNGSNYSGFVIGAVKEVGGVYQPRDVYTSNPPYSAGVDYTGSSICISLETTYQVKLTVFDFGDGRKLGVLSSYNSAGTATAREDWWSSIYIGPLNVDGTNTPGCAVFSSYVYHSYIEAYDVQPSTSTLTYLPNISKTAVGGFLYDTDDGKDFLVKMNLAINNKVYIPNIYMFSDVLQRAKAGTTITIDNRKYVCAANRSSTQSVICFPEEVN